MNKIDLNDEIFDCLGWYKCYGAYCIVAKAIGKEDYTHLSHKHLSDLWGRLDLAKTIPSKYLSQIDFPKDRAVFYELDEKTNIFIIYDMGEKCIVKLSNKKDNSRIINYKHIDIVDANNCTFVLSNVSKYKNKKIEIKKLVLSSPNKLKEISDSKQEFMILTYLNASFYNDEDGTLRFYSKTKSPSTEMIEQDLNKAWSDFHSGRFYTLRNMIDYYMETNSSFCSFIGTFESYFIDEDNDNKYYSNKKIKQIINSELGKL